MLVIIISIISMTTSYVLNRVTNLTFSHNNNSVDLWLGWSWSHLLYSTIKNQTLWLETPLTLCTPLSATWKTCSQCAQTTSWKLFLMTRCMSSIIENLYCQLDPVTAMPPWGFLAKYCCIQSFLPVIWTPLHSRWATSSGRSWPLDHSSHLLVIEAIHSWSSSSTLMLDQTDILTERSCCGNKKSAQVCTMKYHTVSTGVIRSFVPFSIGHNMITCTVTKGGTIIALLAFLW